MKVTIKDLAINMELGNRGVEFDVYDANNNHLGDFRVGKAKIEWCKGKTQKGNGIQKSWEELIRWFQNG